MDRGSLDDPVRHPQDRGRYPVAAGGGGLIRALFGDWEATDRYGAVFGALLLVLIASPFLSARPVVRVGMVLLVAAVVLLSLRATGLHHAGPLVVALLAVTVVLAIVAAGSGDAVVAIVFGVLAIGLASGPPNIVARIFEFDRIRFQLVVAALCAYLQVGLAFAFGVAAIDFATTADVFAQGPASGFFDYVYYSFVTLTTVGYGDLTVTADVVRAMAIVETLLGQIFLVVLVAYLVGTLAGSRSSTQRRS